jgi:hypothetical protein
MNDHHEAVCSSSGYVHDPRETPAPYTHIFPLSGSFQKENEPGILNSAPMHPVPAVTFYCSPFLGIILQPLPGHEDE